MSKARSNLFVFTDKRLMKKTVGILTAPSHSAAGINRLWHALIGLILAGLVAWIMVMEGVSGWGYLCFLALLICSPGVGAISIYAGPGSLEARHQPCLVSFKLRSERDLMIDVFKYYDPVFTKDIDFQIAKLV